MASDSLSGSVAGSAALPRTLSAVEVVAGGCAGAILASGVGGDAWLTALARLLVWAAAGRLLGLVLLHIGLWHRRSDSEAPGSRRALALGIAEAALLAAGIAACGVVEIAPALLLPVALLGVEGAIRRPWLGTRTVGPSPERPTRVWSAIAFGLAVAFGVAAIGGLAGVAPAARSGETWVLLLVGAGWLALVAASWTPFPVGPADPPDPPATDAPAEESAEESADRSEAALREIFNTMSDGVMVGDCSGRLLFSNPAAASILGGNRSQEWSDHFSAHLADGITPIRDSDLPLVRALRGETTDGVEVFLRHSRNPRGAYVRFTGRPLRDGGGRTRGGVVVVSDVTEIKLIEEKLLEKVQLLDLAHDAIIVRSLEGRIQFWNRGAEEMYGWSKPDALEQTAHVLLDARFPQPLEALNAALYREGAWQGELSHARRDGVRLVVESRWVLKRDARGRPSAVMEINRDVTARRQVEREIALAKESAEDASRAKSQFMANMSHELRTPMNGVLGMLDLTLRTGLAPRQREWLAMARSSGHSLLRVLNDILDFSKIEARKLELESIPFRLRDLVGETVKSFAVQTQQKGLALTCRFAPDLPDVGVGDPGRLRQVLTNLLNNAFKFTAAGEIAVECAVASRVVGSVVMTARVRDTGEGIPASKHSLVFEAFTQADSSATRKYGGTGLGLAICRQLVGMMGGRIEIESEPGRGSTFSFTVRLGVPSNRASRRFPDGETWRDLRVLVADGHATARAVTAELLRGWGMQVTEAGSGPDALAELHRASASGSRFQLMVLETRLPEVDGRTVAEGACKDPALACPVVFVHPPVSGSPDSERLSGRTTETHVRKPVLPRELAEAVRGALTPSGDPARPSPASGPEKPAARPPARPLRILVAEDNEVNQVLAQVLLEERGHRVVAAEDGRRALELVGGESFDVALMDVAMPELDGYQVVRELRRREAGGGGRLPVIAMTAHARASDRDRCLAAGMDDYLSKPIDGDELVALVEEWGERCREGGPERSEPGGDLGAAAGGGEGKGGMSIGEEEGKTDGGERPPTSGADGGTSTVGGGEMSNEDRDGVAGESTRTAADTPPEFDREVALRRARGKRDLLLEMARLFLRDAPALLDTLREAEEKADVRTLERVAHRLVGSLGNFGATAALDLARTLEEMARRNDFADAARVRGDLEHRVRGVLTGLANLRKEYGA